MRKGQWRAKAKKKQLAVWVRLRVVFMHVCAGLVILTAMQSMH